jgi:hypothetical protein
VPADDEAVVMTVAPDPPVPLLTEAAGEPVAADPVLLLLPPLEHAAASTATPTAPATPVASLAAPGIRLTLESHIVILLPSGAAVPNQLFLPPKWVSM